jgi:hypothetical protein
MGSSPTSTEPAPCWVKCRHERTASRLELATDRPGFVFEPADSLGESLMLAGDLENRRAELEQRFPSWPTRVLGRPTGRPRADPAQSTPVTGATKEVDDE